jgi:hypothetical protein
MRCRNSSGNLLRAMVEETCVQYAESDTKPAECICVSSVNRVIALALHSIRE